MIDQIQNWINGSQDYFTGVVLLSKTGADPDLIRILNQGPNYITINRLKKDLLKYLENYESIQEEQTITEEKVIAQATIATDQPLPNPELYASCKKDADMTYKESMNTRAELFIMARKSDIVNINDPLLIDKRIPLTIAAVSKFIEASKKYDIADHVKKTGKLPGHAEPDEEKSSEEIPDHLVYTTLSNYRKNLSKIKKKPETPDRTAKIQELTAAIENLNERWLLLKP